MQLIMNICSNEKAAQTAGGVYGSTQQFGLNFAQMCFIIPKGKIPSELRHLFHLGSAWPLLKDLRILPSDYQPRLEALQPGIKHSHVNNSCHVLLHIWTLRTGALELLKHLFNNLKWAISISLFNTVLRSANLYWPKVSEPESKSNVLFSY